jgi:threonine/homoserine/homoserine lactone efflux protein
MTAELLIALVGFAAVSSLTPGPNNLMLMASGANFGFRRTVPHMLGVGVGFTVMIALVGAGLMAAFDRWPVLHDMLKVVAVLYLGWLAWKIAHAAVPQAAGAEARPMTFFQAAAFQWANPKAWSMALTAIAAYAPDRTLLAVLSVALVFGAVNLPSVSVWTVLGGRVRLWLTDARRLTIFNRTMAALLIASLVPVVLA